MKTYALVAMMLNMVCAACVHDQNTQITYQKKPIQDLFLYDRDTRPVFLDLSRQNIRKHGDFILPWDSAYDQALSLKAYVFNSGHPSRGLLDRCLCFCWKAKTIRQIAFIYKGEHPMTPGEWQRQSGDNTSLGRQLSQFALDFGPKLSQDRKNLSDFLKMVMIELLNCPELTKEMLDKSLSNPNARDHFNNFEILKPQRSAIIPPCQDRLRLIQKQMADQNPNLFFFQGEMNNGIWQAKIVSGYGGTHQIKLDYLNGECAYKIAY
jgi:hypothetical protein